MDNKKITIHREVLRVSANQYTLIEPVEMFDLLLIVEKQHTDLNLANPIDYIIGKKIVEKSVINN